MKKLLFLAAAVLIAASLISCGEAVPKKELEDAQTAMKRAESVEASVYSPQELISAQSDYDSATNLVEAKNNKDAKVKALNSYTNATMAFENARVKRAEDIVSKCSAAMENADRSFASLLFPDTYPSLKQDLDSVKAQLDKKDYEGTYSNGVILKPKLDDLYTKSADMMSQAKTALASAQDKYDSANNSDVVRQYAADDMKAASAKLEEALKSYNAGDLSTATSKAKEVEAMVAAAVDKANTAYQAALAAKQKDQQAIDLQKQQEAEAQKQKAADYINQAKQRLEQLKAKKKTSYLLPSKTESGLFIAESDFLGQIAEPAASEDASVTNNIDIVTNISEAGAVPAETNNEPVTMETVQKYIDLADQSYQKEEYLDSMDYAREAIRLADILLAKPEEVTYTVQLKPEDRDCLWKISGYMYNNRFELWPLIWKANKFQIQDPDLIYPGQVFKIPPSPVNK